MTSMVWWAMGQPVVSLVEQTPEEGVGPSLRVGRSLLADTWG